MNEWLCCRFIHIKHVYDETELVKKSHSGLFFSPSEAVVAESVVVIKKLLQMRVSIISLFLFLIFFFFHFPYR